jgi:hypothetical protein
MLQIIPLSMLQCLLLSGGQVLLKFALTEMGSFQWSDDKPQLRLRYVCRNSVLSRASAAYPLDWRTAHHGRMFPNRKIT